MKVVTSCSVRAFKMANASCSFIDIGGRFRGAYCLCHQGDPELIAASIMRTMTLMMGVSKHV